MEKVIIGRVKKSLLLVIVLTTFQSCFLTTQFVEVNTEDQEIPFYSDNSTLKGPYQEVIHLELTGSIFTTRKRMKSKLIQKAKANNCDAVINVNFKTTFIWPQAFGIGIRYDN